MNNFYQSDFPVNSFAGKEDALATGVFGGFMIGYFLLIGLFFIALYIISAYSLMKMSADSKKGRPWFAWIPILRHILWLNLGGFSGWYLFLTLIMAIPFLGWLAYGLFFIYVWSRISVNFSKPAYLGLFSLVPAGIIVLPLYFAFMDKIEKKS